MKMSNDIVSSENTCLSVSMHLIILICKQFVTQKLHRVLGFLLVIYNSSVLSRDVLCLS